MPQRRSRDDPARVALRSAATAMKAHEAFGAAASVIAARSGMTGLTYANAADATEELGLMVTEKVAAFSEAGAAVSAGASEAASRHARFATDEAVAAGRSMTQLAACRSPMEVLQLQTRLATEFWSRSMAYGMGLNALACRTGERALHPVHKAVVANDKRLKAR
jgi:hypothetical protein